MDGSAPAQPGGAGAPRRIRNTFSRAENEYFTPATLFSLCKYGFPFEKLPEEAKEMVREYSKYHTARCTRSEGEIRIASLDVGPGNRLV
ncbi:hypothetical protein IBTHAUMO2_150015 [Nitrosopumilaceae archaeon]|nr:hypothetical protein [Nitrosopumilus sp.]MDA7945782.1 hypothetical protein [Nitrosopumilus sp.]MDA7954804.1 hypothetical protein [Nitrosopumilus sp.]MDA7974514.1 hypothetical protein [Nitrosopumilus sp.]CAI9831060.1 hypothetical protein IBTHAUMO2_150015 [Nitrosopumilaceae archaeon]